MCSNANEHLCLIINWDSYRGFTLCFCIRFARLLYIRWLNGPTFLSVVTVRTIIADYTAQDPSHHHMATPQDVYPINDYLDSHIAFFTLCKIFK